MRGAARGTAAIAIALAALLPGAASAEDDDEREAKPLLEAAEDEARPSPSGLPGFMRHKRRMRADDLADKVEGGYFTGLPLANSDPDTGVGFGARVLYFHNGARDSAMFAYTPYRHRAYGQAFFTTKGWQYHTLDYDGLYLGDAPVRLRASLVYERNIAANYFGAGARSLGRLRFPGDDRAYADYGEYADALRTVQPEGAAYTRYDQYILERPLATATLERDLFGGVVRALVGFTASRVNVRQWSGELVKAVVPGEDREVDARQAPTRLAEDCAAGRVIGCAGGFNNTLKLGLAYDTRDFEPNPNSGWFVELTGELAGRPVGSEYDWARLTFSPKVYWSPLPALADVVLAARRVTQVQSDGVPYFAMNGMSVTDYNRAGLGGLRTLRGYKQDRFVGRATVLANLELRWTMFELAPARRQHFAFMLVPFLDVGRVFDTPSDCELRRFRHGQGAGLRIAWNQATIVVVDYAFSREHSTLYINFNHPF